MVRSGAIAKRVIKELGELGCDPVSGECPEELKQEAKDAFAGRTTADYYSEGNFHEVLCVLQNELHLKRCRSNHYRKGIRLEFPN